MLLTILFFLSQALWARNIVLLTSLPLEQAKIEKKLERIFLKDTRDLTGSYEIIVKHRADQEELFKALNDPETHAVFWLSHGGYLKAGKSKGVKPTPILLDYQRDNVAQTFQKIHPYVKFVGVVGCNSEQILGNTIEMRQDLDYFIPKKKVIAQLALRKALKHFKRTERTRDNTLAELFTPETFPVTIIRKTGNGDVYKSLKVFLGGKLLSMLPKMPPQSQKEFTINIPLVKDFSRANLKLVFESGQSPHDESDYFGQMQLILKGEMPWMLFSKPTGEPFGTNERIYIYKGSLDSSYF